VFKYYCAIAQIHKGKYMKKILAVIAASVYLMSPTANAQTITGAGATFILMYREPKNTKNSQETIKFFDWAFVNGAKMSADLDYVPLPRAVTDRIRSDVWTQIKK
jgi:ABC-type phosphate transport system substrate-binding protein